MNLSPDAIRFELEVMDCSHKAGVKTPEVFQNSNGTFASKFNDTLAMAMSYVDGENMKKQSVSDEIVYETGIEVGKMDIALSQIKDSSRTRPGYIFDLKNFLTNESNIDLLPSNYSKEIFHDVVKEFKEKESLIWSLPKGVIHNDITLHNLLVRYGKLEAIIDFSDIAFNPYIQNIAVAMSQLVFTYNWQPYQATIFIKGYTQQKQLSEGEIDLLYLVTLTRYTTLVVEFNRWGVEEGDSGVNDFIVDNYKFIRDFISLGKENFTSLVRAGLN